MVLSHDELLPGVGAIVHEASAALRRWRNEVECAPRHARSTRSPVVVTLRPPLDQFASGADGGDPQEELQKQLADIVADLGLPADLVLTVTSAWISDPRSNRLAQS